MKSLGSLKCFNPVVFLLLIKIDIFLHKDLLHINILHQYLPVCLLNLIMNFVFSDEEPPLISVVYGGSGIYGYFE